MTGLKPHSESADYFAKYPATGFGHLAPFSARKGGVERLS